MTKLLKVFAFILLLIPFAAWAHGDAAWIMEDEALKYCCGPDDCHPIVLTSNASGYEFDFVFHNEAGEVVFEKYFRIPYGDYRVKFTENPRSEGKAWACVQMRPYAYNFGELICLILNMGV